MGTLIYKTTKLPIFKLSKMKGRVLSSKTQRNITDNDNKDTSKRTHSKDMKKNIGNQRCPQQQHQFMKKKNLHQLSIDSNKNEKKRNKEAYRDQLKAKIQNSQQKGNQQQLRQKKSKKKKKKKQTRKQKEQSKNQSSKNKNGKDKVQSIDLDELKLQQYYERCFPKQKATKKQDYKLENISFQDSERIIYLYSLDAGDYKGLRQAMPHIHQKKIRRHLQYLFNKCLNVITQRAREGGRKIKDWETGERREIIRELHRIRSSNRLLSESNVQFRETFIKIMSNCNHPETIVSETEIAFLYRKIQAFVRGFNQINFHRKNYYVPPDQVDERRLPIIQGGYIMENKIKRQGKKNLATKNKILIDPQKLILQWTQQEQRGLALLYLSNHSNHEYIIQNLRAKFGENDKWKDFQILGKKIDNLIKQAVNRLQELTNKMPYNRLQKIEEDKKKEQQDRNRKGNERNRKIVPNSMEDLTGVVYHNREMVRREEDRQGSIITNPSLLLRQVFAHLESFKVKHCLVNLLVKKYPEESELQETIQAIKQFTEWAQREEENNHVTLVRARPPVIDDGTRSHTFTVAETDSQRQNPQTKREQIEQALFSSGLNLLYYETDCHQKQTKREEQENSHTVFFSNSKFNFDSYGTLNAQQMRLMQPKKYENVAILKKEESEVIQIYQSEESQYEGFLNQHECK